MQSFNLAPVKPQPSKTVQLDVQIQSNEDSVSDAKQGRRYGRFWRQQRTKIAHCIIMPCRAGK